MQKIITLKPSKAIDYNIGRNKVMKSIKLKFNKKKHKNVTSKFSIVKD